jgi:hypothetical protein
MKCIYFGAMEQWFDRLTTPRKIEGRFGYAHRPERLDDSTELVEV